MKNAHRRETVKRPRSSAGRRRVSHIARARLHALLSADARATLTSILLYAVSREFNPLRRVSPYFYDPPPGERVYTPLTTRQLRDASANYYYLFIIIINGYTLYKNVR